MRTDFLARKKRQYQVLRINGIQVEELGPLIAQELDKEPGTDGIDAGSPGLRREVGGNGELIQGTVIAETFSDFEKGQIPFYTYDYTSGSVEQNGQLIWAGRTLAETITALKQRFTQDVNSDGEVSSSELAEDLSIGDGT